MSSQYHDVTGYLLVTRHAEAKVQGISLDKTRTVIELISKTHISRKVAVLAVKSMIRVRLLEMESLEPQLHHISLPWTASVFEDYATTILRLLVSLLTILFNLIYVLYQSFHSLVDLFVGAGIERRQHRIESQTCRNL